MEDKTDVIFVIWDNPEYIFDPVDALFPGLAGNKYLSKINYTYLTTSCLLPLASCLSSLGN